MEAPEPEPEPPNERLFQIFTICINPSTHVPPLPIRPAAEIVCFCGLFLRDRIDSFLIASRCGTGTET